MWGWEGNAPSGRLIQRTEQRSSWEAQRQARTSAENRGLAQVRVGEEGGEGGLTRKYVGIVGVGVARGLSFTLQQCERRVSGISGGQLPATAACSRPSPLPLPLPRATRYTLRPLHAPDTCASRLSYCYLSFVYRLRSRVMDELYMCHICHVICVFMLFLIAPCSPASTPTRHAHTHGHTTHDAHRAVYVHHPTPHAGVYM
jgi:hypothetical protein